VDCTCSCSCSLAVVYHLFVVVSLVSSGGRQARSDHGDVNEEGTNEAASTEPHRGSEGTSGEDTTGTNAPT